MTVADDPEGVSAQAIAEFIDLGEKRILEIGCGKGRLTFSLAEFAEHITAIDPDEEDIHIAIDATPAHLKDRILFFPQGIEEYHHPQDSSLFDLSIFTWSL